MTSAFILVGICDVPRAMAVIADRIDHVAAEAGEPWTSGDVEVELKAGRASLWATPGFDTFVVTTIDLTPWGRDFRVWIGSNVGGAPAKSFMGQVRTMARAADCKRVVFESARRWERALPGVTVRHTYAFPVEQ